MLCSLCNKDVNVETILGIEYVVPCDCIQHEMDNNIEKEVEAEYDRIYNKGLEAGLDTGYKDGYDENRKKTLDEVYRYAQQLESLLDTLKKYNNNFVKTMES